MDGWASRHVCGFLHPERKSDEHQDEREGFDLDICQGRPAGGTLLPSFLLPFLTGRKRWKKGSGPGYILPPPIATGNGFRSFKFEVAST